ncbi:hypothetical protein MLD52_04820 [Puniceicoccaceae bacterium K14]|nr:hypothetical protein [Puniceicoccaceae bacterium K14]
MNTLSNQAANGQRINKLSDDSASANRILDMQEEKGRITQYTRNSERAENINNTTISQLNNLLATSERINEIAVLSNDLKGEEGLQAYAEEVNELIEHALQSVNSRFNGEYIFGGIASGNPPFEVNTDADGHIVEPATGDAVTYVGAEDGPSFHLSETGKVEPFTDGDTNRKFSDFLNRMVELRDALESGNSNAVTQTMREDLEASEDDLIFTLSRQGSVQMRIDFDKNLNEQRFSDLESNISAEADVDIAQVMVMLTQAQTSYQATLQSAGQILNSSLLDYV